MENETCYLCEEPLKSGQSFYEGHSKKVCLSCYRTTPRCTRCRFPSHDLIEAPGIGKICEFCKPDVDARESKPCYICGTEVFLGMSHYADYDKVICQSCFKDAKTRCFQCRFPKIERVHSGFGGICEFCQGGFVDDKTDLAQLLGPLLPFLKNFGHPVELPKKIKWIDWKVILGMQVQNPDDLKMIHFFDELIVFCYPIYQVSGVFYIIPKIQKEWFLPYMAGQMVAWDLCGKHNLPHLLGEGPFHQLARGWVHWISYQTAKVLKFEQPTKKLSRFPDSDLIGGFPRFLAMSEYRKTKEIIRFSQDNLNEYAQKYL